MDYRKEYHRWLDAGACEPIDDEKEIEECFYKDLKFGTGGIRAIMGPGPNKLNKYTIRKNTEGFARFIESKGEEAKRKGVVIACDNRRNSQFFCEEAAKVLATHDIHVYLFESLKHQATVFPKQHVGFKFFNVYGPNEYIKGSMASMIFHGYKQIMESGKVRLIKSCNPNHADGGQLRDFVYVKDICDVMYWMLEHPEVNGFI